MYYGKNLEATQMPINIRVDNQIVAYSYNIMVYNNKN
jgi:hypothetical protein